MNNKFSEIGQRAFGFVRVLAPILSISLSFLKLPCWARLTLVTLGVSVLLYVMLDALWPLNRYARSYRANGALYGYRYDRLEVSVQVQTSGSAFVRRIVKVTSLMSEMRALHHYLFVPGSKEKLQELPPLEAEVASIQPPNRTLTLAQVSDRMEPGTSRYVIEIDPPLAKRKSIEYKVEESAPQGTFALTMAELRGTEWEFMAWEISRPTKELVLEVKIPYSLATERHRHDVWRGTEYGAFTIVNEFDRVEPGWSIGRTTISDRDHVVATLKVKWPILGMRYVVTWLPQDAATARAPTGQPIGDTPQAGATTW